MKYLKILSAPPPQSPNKQQQQQSYFPYILTLISSTIFPFAWLYCNQNNIPTSVNTIFRGICCIGIHYVTCRLSQSPTHIDDPASYKYLIIRSVIMTFYSIIFSISQFVIPLPISHTISCSGVIFVFLIDYFINGVQINRNQCIGIIIGIIGVLMTGNSKIILLYFDSSYKGDDITEFKHYLTQDIRIITAFILFFIFYMFVWAYAVVITKQIKANTYQINFIMGFIIEFIGVIMYFLPNLTNNQNTVYQITFSQSFWISVLTAIPLVIAQTVYIGALKLAKSSGIVSMLGFLGVGIGYFLSIFRYHEQINIVGIVGVVFVFGGVWRTIFGKRNVLNGENGENGENNKK